MNRYFIKGTLNICTSIAGDRSDKKYTYREFLYLDPELSLDTIENTIFLIAITNKFEHLKQYLTKESGFELEHIQKI